jgi:hypothetical protein
MKRQVILHPILFGLYPVLFAYAHNVDFAPPAHTLILLLALSGGCAALLWAAFAYLTGDPRTTAIALSVLIVMFFSYGHLMNLLAVPLWDFHVWSIRIGAVKAIAGAWIIIGLTVGRWLSTSSPDAARTVTVAMNRVGAALLLLTISSLAVSGYVSRHEPNVERRQSRDTTPARSPDQTRAGNRDLPDIYYIILDDYARPDTLKELYQYDDSGFIDSLKAKGFYVADQSHSNYSQTMLSLASSLNSEYLEAPRLMSAQSSDSRWHVAVNAATGRFMNTAFATSRRPLAHMIQYSNTARTLKAHGYRFVAFTSGYGGVQFPNADVVMHARVFDDFEEALIGTTPIPDVLERFYDPLDLHRQRVSYVLDHLADRFDHDAPLFVFAHVYCPHPPFIFGPDGAPVRRDRSKPPIIFDGDVGGIGEADRGPIVKAYRDQVQFVNRKIDSAIAAILANAPRPPIIILQSDHGSNLTLDQTHPSAAGIRERMSILNAYHVPGEIRRRLYPRISPVNTFRIILGEYFAGTWGLLPDRSYFSRWDSPYEFLPVSRLLGPADSAAGEPESSPISEP